MRLGSLSHRWIVAGERSRREDDDAAEATRALREMISSGRLSKLIPIKDGDRLQTELIEQEGPIAYVESTTRERVFDEDENRLLSLHTDERPDQTRRVIQRLAADAAGGAGEEPGGIIRRHHAVQRLLRRAPVVIPFAKRLGKLVPTERVEARRAFPHLLGRIRAMTLLHQFQRDRDEHGRLIATRDDYAWARWLVAGPLTRLLGSGASKAALRFLERVKTWSPALPFSTAEARRREKVGKSAVCECLKELNEAGLVELVSAGHGNQAATWRVNRADDDTPEAGSVLPTVDELFSRAEG